MRFDTGNKFALHSEKGQIARDLSTIGPDTSFGQAIGTIRWEIPAPWSMTTGAFTTGPGSGRTR